jgi:hypothetical protein
MSNIEFALCENWNMFEPLAEETFIHKKKFCPFPSSHIVIIIQFDNISTTFGHLKFVSGLLH